MTCIQQMIAVFQYFALQYLLIWHVPKMHNTIQHRIIQGLHVWIIILIPVNPVDFETLSFWCLIPQSVAKKNRIISQFGPNCWSNQKLFYEKQLRP